MQLSREAEHGDFHQKIAIMMYGLSIDKKRDVIEYPINDLLDVNGWDVRKTLGLLRKYNPALMEWLDSPIVYREEYQIRERMKEIRTAYFAKKTSMHHYLSMAASNYRSYLKGKL